MYIFIYIQKLNMSNTKSNNGGTASEERKTPYDDFDPKKTQRPYGLDRKRADEIKKKLIKALGKEKLTSLDDIYRLIGIEPEEHKTVDEKRVELKEKLREALGLKELTSLADIYGLMGIEPKGDSKANREEGR